MIVFPCKQCGKRLRQPDEAGGSLIFCSCGQANRVPWESAPATEAEAPDEREERRGSRRRADPVDPAYCLEHRDILSQGRCGDCGESFCPRCLVAFQGTTLCAPCKNLRVRRLQRARPTSGLAVAALMVGLVGSPFLLCTTAMPASQDAPDGVRIAAALGGMIIPALALVLGALALRQIEADGEQGGRSMAWTGIACAVAGLCLSASAAFQGILQIWGG